MTHDGSLEYNQFMRRYSQKHYGYQPRSVRRIEKKLKKNIFLTVLIVLALAYFALTWGLPALIGSLGVFNKLKAEDTQNKPITEDVAIAPPVLNIPFEATNTAKIRVTGYAEPKSKVEFYINDELRIDTQTMDNGNFEVNDLPLSVGNNNITGKTVTNGDKRSLPSKVIRVLYSNEKPKLEVTEPSDELLVKGESKKVRVSGKSETNNTVTVNGSTVILNNDGNFSTEVGLNDGENSINVVATNSFGNTTQISRKVKYEQ